MASILRGFAFGENGDDAGAARANVGSIDSRSGSERAMPAPCKNRRREIGRREIKGAMGIGCEFIDVPRGIGRCWWASVRTTAATRKLTRVQCRSRVYYIPAF